MRFTTRLIVFGYPLVEFLLVWLIASVIGWGWALIGILLSIPIGIAVMRNASAGSRVVLQESDPERAMESTHGTLDVSWVCLISIWNELARFAEVGRYIWWHEDIRIQKIVDSAADGFRQ